MSRWAAALAAAVALAGCTLPWTVQARSFTTGFKAGETLRYDLHTVVDGSLGVGSQSVPLTSDQELRETLAVKSVDRSGTATVEITAQDLVSAATGGSGTPPAPATLQVGRDGRIKSGAATTLGGPIPSIPGSDQLTPVLAGRPVKPGDAWDVAYTRPNPFGGGGFQFATHNRYLRDEAVAGRQAAVIESDLSGPVDFSIDFSRLPVPPAPTNPPTAITGTIQYTGNLAAKTTYWVDLETDRVLKSSGSGTYVIAYSTPAVAGVSGAQQVAFNGTIKTDRTGA